MPGDFACPPGDAGGVTVTPEEIIAEARRWLGTPWRHQGRTRAGVDCAGLVVMVARSLTLADYDVSGYSRRASGFDFVRHFQAAMAAVRVAEAVPGDVLVFADGAYPCHCGFLSLWQDHPHLIHAHVSRRQVVEEPYIGEWPAKVRFAFRFPGTSSAPEIRPETIISGEAE